MWDINSTIQMMQALGLSANADDLMQVFANHMRRAASVDRALVINRLDLVAPRYRVVRCIDWAARQGRFVQAQTNDIRQGGLLAELVYAGELRQIAGLSISAGEPAYDLLRGHKGLMAFPMFDKGLGTGAIILLSVEAQEQTPSELCGLAMMTGLVGRSMEIQSLTRQVEDTCRALDRELAAAADVQRWLLPPALPILPGVSIATSYSTATRSSGDYYDAMHLPDGRLGFLIADVSGHGAPAAVLMAVVRTMVHLEQSRWTHPAALLHEINRHLCHLNLLERGAFVTAFCAILDPGSGQLVYSSAGHPPPRLVSIRQGRITGLGGVRALPLGLDMDTRYDEARICLSTHDTILLYTDGIVEASSAAGELFGVERLDGALRALDPALNEEQTIRLVLGAVEEFSSRDARSDDQTLVAIKFSGPDSARRPCGEPCVSSAEEAGS